MTPLTQSFPSSIIVDACLEIQLLLHCARTKINKQTAAQIKHLAQQSIDWSYLLQIGAYHAVMPLLFNSLNTTCPEEVPQPILAQLRQFFHANAAYNLVKTQELLAILRLLEKNSLFVIPFKGPVLTARAYGNLSLRQFNDLDILIHRQDIFSVQELLRSQGYQLASNRPLNKTHELMYLRAACEFNYFNAEKRISIEPHWDFTPRRFSISLNIDAFWKHSQKILLEETTVPVLSIEDELFVVCLNGTKDYWKSLKHICDIAELIRCDQTIDWDKLIKQTQDLGCQRILLLGLSLAHEVLGVTLPDGVWSRIKTDSALPALVSQVTQALFNEVEQPSKSVGANFSRWDMQVRERLRDKVWYCLNLIFGPNEGDVEFLLLPVSLVWLYPLIRPLRLATRLVLSLLRKGRYFLIHQK